ncbi:MAG: DUF1648 domain-containing protein [Pirellula sp.]
MITFRNITIAQALLWLVALLQNWVYWQRLPERVATHFDASGKADGWMSRDGATLMMVGMQTVMPLLFVGIAYWIYFIPSHMINIPHREFWLHQERREETISFVARSTAFFSLGLSLFFMGMNYLTYRANLSGGDLNPVAFWVLLGSFLTFTAMWVTWLLVRFRVPGR